MPKATSLTDRRRHGRGDNNPGVTHGKANLQDQRKKSAYAPKVAASATRTEFDQGVSVGRTMSAGASVGSSRNRAAPTVRRLGERK